MEIYGFWTPKVPVAKPKVFYPDPYRFKILDYVQIGSCVVVKIQYLGCIKYEILVYDDTDVEELKRSKSIDPHFSDSTIHKSPIAKFEPTEQGWIYAVKFCSSLKLECLEVSY